MEIDVKVIKEENLKALRDYLDLYHKYLAIEHDYFLSEEDAFVYSFFFC